MQAGVLGNQFGHYHHSSIDFGQAPKPRIPAVRPTAVVNDVPSTAHAANHRCVPGTPLRRWSQREVNGWVPASSDVHVCTPRRGRRPNMRSFAVCRPCLSRVAGNEKDECWSKSHYCIAALTTDPKQILKPPSVSFATHDSPWLFSSLASPQRPRPRPHKHPCAGTFRVRASPLEPKGLERT